MPMETSSHLLAEYDKALELYRAFSQKLGGLMDEILSAQSINVHSVSCRLKGRVSFANKLAQADGKYRVLGEVTDVAGVRVITYFGDDVDKVARVVTSEFEIDRANSVDKRDLLDPDRFGYLSLHYVVSLRPDRSALVEYAPYANLKAEVQIRSILQHAWAEIEHDLGYKSSQGVPREFRRQFSRLAGLLEIADSEFVAIREGLLRYERLVAEQITRAPDAVLIDKASLGSFVATNEVVKSIDEAIAAKVQTTVDGDSGWLVDLCVVGLQFFGLKTIGDVNRLLAERASDVISFASAFIGDGSPSLTPGVAVLCLQYVLLGDTNDFERTRAFFEMVQLGVDVAQRTEFAEKVLATHSEIRRSREERGPTTR